MSAANPWTELVYRAHVTLEPRIDHGDGPLGTRYRIPITGGTFEGPAIRGRIVPGGVDWQLLRSDGALLIEADYFIETHDGVAIHVRNCGLVRRTDNYVMTTPVFEAPNGAYAWMNDYIFCGTIEPEDGPPLAVNLLIYRIMPGR